MRISDWSSDVCSSDLRWFYRQPLFLSHEFNYASRDFGPFSFIAGVYGLHIVNETEANLWGDTFLYLARAKTDSFAVYGEGTLKLTDRLSLLAGIRYSFDTLSLRGTNLAGADRKRDVEGKSVSVRVNIGGGR